MDKFSQYSLIPENIFDESSRMSEIEIISGNVKISEKIPENFELPCFFTFSKNKLSEFHNKICELKIVEIKDNCELKITKGNSHFIFLIEDSSAVIRLNSSKNDFESISFDLFSKNSDVVICDILTNCSNCFSQKRFFLNKSNLRNISLLSNRENSFGRTHVSIDRNSESSDVSLILGKNSSSYDISSTLQHREGNSNGEIITKAVMRGESGCVVWGMIDIAKDAQKSQSYQSSKTLLMSDRAISKVIPQLEIQADDVKATHGATISKIREEDLYYLQSRGISKGEAERIMGLGFLEEPIFDLPSKISQSIINELLQLWK